MAESQRNYPMIDTPNSEILDNATTGGPPLPTISELRPSAWSPARWLLKGWRSLFFIPNGEFAMDVIMQRHVEPLLADSALTASDVYMVFRPDKTRQVKAKMPANQEMYHAD
ncbi:MAG: hypothetical protein Q9188_003514 [Gyalolechia gomerana]